MIQIHKSFLTLFLSPCGVRSNICFLCSIFKILNTIFVCFLFVSPSFQLTTNFLLVFYEHCRIGIEGAKSRCHGRPLLIQIRKSFLTIFLSPCGVRSNICFPCSIFKILNTIFVCFLFSYSPFIFNLPSLFVCLLVFRKIAFRFLLIC